MTRRNLVMGYDPLLALPDRLYLNAATPVSAGRRRSLQCITPVLTHSGRPCLPIWSYRLATIATPGK